MVLTPPSVRECVREWGNVRQHCKALWIKALYKCSPFTIHLTARFPAKAEDETQDQGGGARLVGTDRPGSGGGGGPGVAGRLRRRDRRLRVPGEREAPGGEEDLQGGGGLLVPQGGPWSPPGPEPGAQGEGGRSAQALRPRAVPVHAGGGVLPEAGLPAAGRADRRRGRGGGRGGEVGEAGKGLPGVPSHQGVLQRPLRTFRQTVGDLHVGKRGEQQRD